MENLYEINIKTSDDEVKCTESRFDTFLPPPPLLSAQPNLRVIHTCVVLNCQFRQNSVTLDLHNVSGTKPENRPAYRKGGGITLALEASPHCGNAHANSRSKVRSRSVDGKSTLTPVQGTFTLRSNYAHAQFIVSSCSVRGTLTISSR
jgi:hypothetical protein